MTSPAMMPRTAAHDDLLHADEARRDRREQAVLDLLREGELDDERQRDALQRGEHERQPEHAGQQRLAVVRAGRADLGQHAAEDEQVEERRDERLRQEAPRIAAQRGERVALAQREERPEVAARRRAAAGLGREAHRRSPPREVHEDVLEAALQPPQLEHLAARVVGPRRRPPRDRRRRRRSGPGGDPSAVPATSTSPNGARAPPSASARPVATTSTPPAPGSSAAGPTACRARRSCRGRRSRCCRTAGRPRPCRASSAGSSSPASRSSSMRSHRKSRDCGSRPVVGSSRKRTCGRCMSARAISSRCAMPPERLLTSSSSRPSRPSAFMTSSARVRRSRAPVAEVGRVEREVLDRLELPVEVRPLRHDRDALLHGHRVRLRRRCRRSRRSRTSGARASSARRSSSSCPRRSGPGARRPLRAAPRS